MNQVNQRPLLREKAVAHKILGPQSAPVISIANNLWLQLFFWLLLLLCATLLLTKTRYKETVAARGILEPILGAQKIISPTAARVERIDVELGDAVAGGDVLAVLTTDGYDREGVSIQRRRAAGLREERRILEDLLLREKESRQQSRLWSELAARHVRERVKIIEREAALFATQIEMSERNLNAVAALLKAGTSSSREFDQQRATHLDLLARDEALSQRQLESRHELLAVGNARRRDALESDKSVLGLRRELQAIDQQLEALGQQQFAVIAEGPGIVAEIGLEVGKPVTVQQPLFYINPEDTAVEATLYVPPAVQGRLVIGQTVLLRLDAFDFRLYGRQEASITAIGRAPVDPRDTPLPIAGIGEPVFKVTAQLAAPNPALEGQYSLQRGSTLVADFVVADMSLLRFIFNPLLQLRGKVT